MPRPALRSTCSYLGRASGLSGSKLREPTTATPWSPLVAEPAPPCSAHCPGQEFRHFSLLIQGTRTRDLLSSGQLRPHVACCLCLIPPRKIQLGVEQSHCPGEQKKSNKNRSPEPLGRRFRNVEAAQVQTLWAGIHPCLKTKRTHWEGMSSSGLLEFCRVGGRLRGMWKNLSLLRLRPPLGGGNLSHRQGVRVPGGMRSSTR